MVLGNFFATGVLTCYVQDGRHLMEELEKVRSLLAKIQCGPLPRSAHNIRDVDPHVLAPVVVSVTIECTRVLQGLTPSVHRPNLVAPEVELQEAMALPLAKAVAHMSTFRLENETPVMARKYVNPPDFEVPSARVDPVSDCLIIKALLRKCREGPRRPTVRLERRRPTPEWDAADPPVHNIEMITREENISAPRELLRLPNPSYTHPDGERWRHYLHLHSRPYFSMPAVSRADERELRYFR